MASITEICNRALGEAGARITITSIDDNSNPARTCKLYFESTRDELLGMAWWNFARGYITLSLWKALPGTPENPNGEASPVWIPAWPAPPWMYSYAYPSDCIRARYIVPQLAINTTGVPLTSAPITTGPQIYGGMPVKFIVASDVDESNAPIKVILTDQSQALLCYAKRITVPSLWDDDFTNAFVFALAAKMAFPLSGKLGLASGLFSKANEIAIDARASDGNEGLTIMDTIPDWIAARSGHAPAIHWSSYINGYGPLFSVGTL